MSTLALKKISRSVIGLAAAVAAGSVFAATQPINAANAVVSIDASFLSANSYVLTPAGAATYTTGTFTTPVASVTTAANPGPITINLGDADGFKLAKGFTALNFSDFSFDVATGKLIGDIKLGNGALFNYQDSAILVASNVTSFLGTEAGTSVSTSASPRSLYLLASGFTIAPELAAFLGDAGVDPALVSPVASVVTKIQIGQMPAVPEPSTYALMGVGLVGVALMSRRKARQA